jgi:predicted esterase
VVALAILSAAGALALHAAGEPPAGILRSIRHGDKSYFYRLLAAGTTEPAPVVVLLHGAGDRPEEMIEAWKGLAREKGITLVAPALPMDPKFEEVAPAVFLKAVDDARAVTRVDSSRVYLFGNSMGGYLALDGAFLESERFAAAAIHGMRLADEYTWVLDRAARKTPIALYIGDRDSFHSLREVRKTRDLLLKRGFPVRYVELDRHGHDYYELSERINADAWAFFSGVTLPAEGPR